MAIDPSVKIDIAAEFTGKKAFDKAGKSTSGLEKSVKNLAKTFGLAFGATAVINFAKASAKAFIEDDNAARSLSVTIKNLGLNYDNNTAVIARFIDNLEQQTGVLDDELRPAMDRLLRATGSVSKSQELLNLSLDIAAGTGKTVTQVSQSLQKAYLGQTAAIGRLGVGISKAELATGKFEDIQSKLTTLFAGQALSAANSYAGQMAKLQVAANNAKETIGEGLVDALKLLSSDTSIDDLNSALESTSLYLADIIRGIGVFIQKLKDIPVAGAAFQLPLDAYIQGIPVLGFYISTLANLGAEFRRLDKSARRFFTGGSGGASRDFVKEREAKALAAKIKADKLAADNKKRLDKIAAANAEKLKKAAAVLDIQKIQIAAALRGKISEEEKIRLQLMQAIEDGNADKAEKLAQKLEEIQKKNKDIADALAAIGEATDPFAAWVTSLDAAVLLLGKMPALLNASGSLTGRGKVTIPTGDGLPGGSIFTPDMTAADIADAATAAADIAIAAADAAAAALIAQNEFVTAFVDAADAATNIADFVTNVPGATDTGSSSIFSPNPYSAVGGPGYGSMNPTINVYVEPQGSVIMPDEFIDAVNDAVLASIRVGYGRTPAGLIG
jgi:hypothetical protein